MARDRFKHTNTNRFTNINQNYGMAIEYEILKMSQLCLNISLSLFIGRSKTVTKAFESCNTFDKCYNE